MPKATLKDVAAKAGVSYQTVSKVINGQVQVSPETEKRIRQIIETLNYQPNVTARNLRTQASNLIGFAWYSKPYNAWQPILDRFLYSVVDAIEAAGYLIVFFNDQGVESYDDISAFSDLYGQKQVAGFVLANTVEDDPRVAYLKKLGVPFTAFGRSNDMWDTCWVDVDGCYGIQRMVRHLVDVGHCHIAYIGWREGLQTGQHREMGYLSGLHQVGLAHDPGWLIRGSDSTQTGAKGIAHFLSLPPDRRPSAVVCASDLVAVGALNAAVAAGLRVGDDIAITGYDNVPMTELLNPPLTTLNQPVQAVGEHVVNLLLRQIKDEPISQKGILLKPELVIRESSVGLASGVFDSSEKAE